MQHKDRSHALLRELTNADQASACVRPCPSVQPHILCWIFAQENADKSQHTQPAEPNHFSCFPIFLLLGLSIFPQFPQSFCHLCPHPMAPFGSFFVLPFKTLVTFVSWNGGQFTLESLPYSNHLKKTCFATFFEHLVLFLFDIFPLEFFQMTLLVSSGFSIPFLAILFSPGCFWWEERAACPPLGRRWPGLQSSPWASVGYGQGTGTNVCAGCLSPVPTTAPSPPLVKAQVLDHLLFFPYTSLFTASLYMSEESVLLKISLFKILISVMRVECLILDFFFV